MGVVSMKQLLEAGVHFGHQTRRWNPKMAPYIFTERNGIYIIDLQKTVKKLEEAYMFIRDISANGEEVLFVGTKKQAGDSIKEEALRANAHYVNARWLGGMMTNYKTIQQRIKRLEQLHTMEEDGTFDLLPKKEVVKLKLEIEKLEKFNEEYKNDPSLINFKYYSPEKSIGDLKNLLIQPKEYRADEKFTDNTRRFMSEDEIDNYFITRGSGVSG